MPVGLDMKDLKELRKGAKGIESDGEAEADDEEDDDDGLDKDLKRVIGLTNKGPSVPAKKKEDKEAAKAQAMKAKEAKDQEQFAKKVDAASVVDDKDGDEKAKKKVSAMHAIVSSLLIKVRGAMANLGKKKEQLPKHASASVEKMQGAISQLDKLVASGAKVARVKKALVGAAKMAKDGHKLLQVLQDLDKKRVG